VQSNCVSIVPVETELGRKRAIDQSTCNKDFSCLKGFCPSFVTVEGGTIREGGHGGGRPVGPLPDPAMPAIDGTHNIVITGVGGTGVVTIGANGAWRPISTARAPAMMEMAGLAQKGGAVHIHVRIAESPEDISAIRVATGECDTLIGGDLVVSAGAKTLGLMTDRADRRGGQQPRDRHRRFHPQHRVPHPRRGPGDWRCRRGCKEGLSSSTRRNCPASFWAIRSSPT
jgi:indolepyruvate ferredoxin oxidoreductase